MRLILLLATLLLLPATALASERDDAKQFTDAMRPLVDALPAAMTQAEFERQARAQVVVDTCAETIRTAFERKRRAAGLEISYVLYMLAPFTTHADPLEVAADERLAALDPVSPLLRRARAARARLTTVAAWPELQAWDFCGALARWKDGGWKQTPLDGLGAPTEDLRKGDFKLIGRAAKLLRRHGATRDELSAFKGDYPLDGLAREDPALRLFKELSAAPQPTRG